jgi:hypothetical protein
MFVMVAVGQKFLGTVGKRDVAEVVTERALAHDRAPTGKLAARLKIFVSAVFLPSDHIEETFYAPG